MLAFGNVLASIGNDLRRPVAEQPVRDKPSDNPGRKKIQNSDWHSHCFLAFVELFLAPETMPHVRKK